MGVDSGSSTQWTKVSSKSKMAVLRMVLFLGGGSFTDLLEIREFLGCGSDFMYWRDCKVWIK